MTCMQIRHAISARLDGEDPGLDDATVYAPPRRRAPTAAPSPHDAEDAPPRRAARRPRPPSPTSRPASSPPSATNGHASSRTPTRATRCAGSWSPSRSCRSRSRSPRWCSGPTPACPVHTARHLGSFDVALGVGFLFAGVEAVAHPRPPAGRRRARRLPGRVVAARRALGQHRRARRGAPRHRLRRAGRWSGSSAARRATRRRSRLAVTSDRVRLARARPRSPSRSRASRPPRPASAHATLLTHRAADRRRLRHAAERGDPALQRAGRGRRSAASACSTATRDRVVTGAPEHPTARQTEVAASLPDLDDGTYVVTWRVTSADAHPDRGRVHVPGRRRRRR